MRRVYAETPRGRSRARNQTGRKRHDPFLPSSIAAPSPSRLSAYRKSATLTPAVSTTIAHAEEIGTRRGSRPAIAAYGVNHPAYWRARSAQVDLQASARTGTPAHRSRDQGPDPWQGRTPAGVACGSRASYMARGLSSRPPRFGRSFVARGSGRYRGGMAPPGVRFSPRKPKASSSATSSCSGVGLSSVQVARWLLRSVRCPR
jgi:hypothetical protein